MKTLVDENVTLPKKGIAKESILEQLREMKEGDVNYKDGKTWSLVYYLGEEHQQFLHDAFTTYLSENGLNPLAFKSLKKMESEVVRMTANMLHGDENVCGTMTSGGTESCLLAVKTYRDYAKKHKPWIKKPEMIVPESIHVAFEKASSYFGVKLVRIPLDDDYKVKIDMVKRKINRNTIGIIASAPSYPHGMIDPIEALGEIAHSHRLPLHVDACLGGFLLPFVEKLQYNVPLFDFRVKGVTSIAADIHKYGYAAKGASIIVYRNMSYLESQFFVSENWAGGVFASPALLGTRAGGAFAAAWAVLHYFGEEGYVEKTKVIMDTTKKIMNGIQEIDGLEVMSTPPMSVFAYRSTDPKLNIFAVADRLEARGWHIDRQQRPECLHCMVMPGHEVIADEYIADIQHAVNEVRDNPHYAYEGGAAMYGMISRVPLRGMVKKQVLQMMRNLYSPRGELPADLAPPEQEVEVMEQAGKGASKTQQKISLSDRLGHVFIRWRRNNQK
ncbi:pyridoxal phosphate-dependent decarboxylase family protein [Longirhabdus pacifica]|uniref:pyridoxal phosphate-dependent decarboxylase family protein n=1 Tax=Longirhabdus pacifica TaxID=2305227 RepID=UPI0010090F0D|nr:aspartate aminotransferase family protein [Longirhabdus pacifica]